MNIIPIYIKINENNPELIYNSVRGGNTYLLESSEGSEKIARYSFIGFNPAAKLTIEDSKIKFQIFDDSLKLKAIGKNPIEVMRNLTNQLKLKSNPEFRFFGGFVGYFSYDTMRYFIDLRGQNNDLRGPDCEFVLAKNNIIFDHKKRETYLVSYEFSDVGDISRGEVVKELEKISDEISPSKKILQSKILIRKLCFRSSETFGLGLTRNTLYCDKNIEEIEKDKNKEKFRSNMTKKEFMENVKKAKRYIYDGDIFQVVLSQRFETEFTGDKFEVYRKLKLINPSPYMYYLDFGDRKIVGSSPEMLVRVEKRRVETYPIAGTRPRGRNLEEDKKLETEMLRDEKERAEHLMLVDLGRNDIGRVAEFNSVEVTKFMDVEKYSHVQHMVSEVTGRLRRDKDEFDALRSIFPAGTVSGAPKVRAMEIINELEPTRRGIYAGCVGYLSFNHNLDMAITIRTIIFEKDKAYIQAGAGIVADSKPEKEYQETVNKAMGMMRALG